MAAVAITLEWDPHPAIMATQFYVAASRFDNFKDPLKQTIDEVIRTSVKQNFEHEGRPAWQPLSNATLIRDQYTGDRKQILVKSGVLKEIVTSARPWTIEKDEAYLISGKLGEAYYGAIHQTGSRWMPARPWLGLTPQEEDKIEEIFSDWAFNTIAEVGLWGRAVGLISGLFRR